MSGFKTPDGIGVLDELELLVVVDNETDTLSSIDEGVPQIPEVVQHAARTPPSRTFKQHACKVVFDQLCCACHGLSVLLTASAGGEKKSMQRIGARLLAPGHCTGWRAKAELARSFAPGRYAPSVVGTKYRLTSTA